MAAFRRGLRIMICLALVLGGLWGLPQPTRAADYDFSANPYGLTIDDVSFSYLYGSLEMTITLNQNMPADIVNWEAISNPQPTAASYTMPSDTITYVWNNTLTPGQAFSVRAVAVDSHGDRYIVPEESTHVASGTFFDAAYYTDPLHNATGVPTAGTITYHFLQPTTNITSLAPDSPPPGFTADPWSSGDTTFTVRYSGLTTSTRYQIDVTATHASLPSSTLPLAFTTAATQTSDLGGVHYTVSPANNSTGAALSGSITFTFTEPTGNITALDLQNEPAGFTLAGAWHQGENSFTVNYTGLQPLTRYDFEVAATVSGAPAQLAYFITTGTVSTDTAPTVTSVSMIDGHAGTTAMTANAFVTFSFDEPVKYVNGTSKVEALQNGAVVKTLTAAPYAGPVQQPSQTPNGGYTTFRSDYALTEGAYTLRISGFVGSEPGHQTVCAVKTYDFIIAPPPKVSGVTPANGSAGAAADTQFKIEFDQPLRYAALAKTTLLVDGKAAALDIQPQINVTDTDDPWAITSSHVSYITATVTGLAAGKHTFEWQPDRSTDAFGNPNGLLAAVPADALKGEFYVGDAPPADPNETRIVSVWPSSGNHTNPSGGGYVLVFNRRITGEGTVTVNGAAQTGGYFSADGASYIIPGSAWANGTYYVTVSGFRGENGVLMSPYSYMFTMYSSEGALNSQPARTPSSGGVAPLSGLITLSFPRTIATVGKFYLDGVLTEGWTSTDGKSYVVPYSVAKGAHAYTFSGFVLTGGGVGEGADRFVSDDGTGGGGTGNGTGGSGGGTGGSGSGTGGGGGGGTGGGPLYPDSTDYAPTRSFNPISAILNDNVITAPDWAEDGTGGSDGSGGYDLGGGIYNQTPPNGTGDDSYGLNGDGSPSGAGSADGRTDGFGVPQTNTTGHGAPFAALALCLAGAVACAMGYRGLRR